MEKKRIFFILPTYPDVMYSFILCLAKKQRYEITIVCLNGLLKEREEIYKDDELSAFVELIIRNKGEALRDFVELIFKKNQHAIFVFGGFTGEVGNALKLYNKLCGKNAIVITEKPSFLPTKHLFALIRILKQIKSMMFYSNAYRHVRDSIKVVLVTGMKGKKQLLSYGIPEEKLYNFMYTHIDENVLPSKKGINVDGIKFVYIGRFNYLNRGMDSLIYAFDRLENENCTLDLVGGYGENAKEIIEWASQKRNVSYIGSWKSDEVINKLREYDVCISPTRVDGWRIQVNQAIMAGIGTITTEESISDELVKESNSGVVVKAFRKNELYKAISDVLLNPSIIYSWKENAMNYRKRITNDVVADYFVRIVEYSFASSKCEKEKPQCPWM